jgi:hypothetical protein
MSFTLRHKGLNNNSYEFKPFLPSTKDQQISLRKIHALQTTRNTLSVHLQPVPQ